MSTNTLNCLCLPASWTLMLQTTLSFISAQNPGKNQSGNLTLVSRCERVKVVKAKHPILRVLTEILVVLGWIPLVSHHYQFQLRGAVFVILFRIQKMGSSETYLISLHHKTSLDRSIPGLFEYAFSEQKVKIFAQNRSKSFFSLSNPSICLFYHSTLQLKPCIWIEITFGFLVLLSSTLEVCIISSLVTFVVRKQACPQRTNLVQDSWTLHF